MRNLLVKYGSEENKKIQPLVVVLSTQRMSKNKKIRAWTIFKIRFFKGNWANLIFSVLHKQIEFILNSSDDVSRNPFTDELVDFPRNFVCLDRL